MHSALHSCTGKSQQSLVKMRRVIRNTAVWCSVMTSDHGDYHKWIVGKKWEHLFLLELCWPTAESSTESAQEGVTNYHSTSYFWLALHLHCVSVLPEMLFFSRVEESCSCPILQMMWHSLCCVNSYFPPEAKQVCWSLTGTLSRWKCIVSVLKHEFAKNLSGRWHLKSCYHIWW